MFRGILFLLLFANAGFAAEPLSVQVGPNWSKEYIEKEYFDLSPFSGLLNFIAEESPLNVVSKIIYKNEDRMNSRVVEGAVWVCRQYRSTWEKIACAAIWARTIGYDRESDVNLCRFMINGFAQIIKAMNVDVFMSNKTFFEKGGRGHVVVNLIVRDLDGNAYSYAMDPDFAGDDRITVHPLSMTAMEYQDANPGVLPRLD